MLYMTALLLAQVTEIRHVADISYVMGIILASVCSMCAILAPREDTGGDRDRALTRFVWLALGFGVQARALYPPTDISPLVHIVGLADMILFHGI
jgi:hypothetical protein